MAKEINECVKAKPGTESEALQAEGHIVEHIITEDGDLVHYLSKPGKPDEKKAKVKNEKSE